MAHSKIDVNDTLVLFADLQAGIADLPLTVPYARLQKGVLALSQLAKLLGMPAVISAVMGQDGNSARIMPEIARDWVNCRFTIAQPPTRLRIRPLSRRLRLPEERRF